MYSGTGGFEKQEDERIGIGPDCWNKIDARDSGMCLPAPPWPGLMSVSAVSQAEKIYERPYS